MGGGSALDVPSFYGDALFLHWSDFVNREPRKISSIDPPFGNSLAARLLLPRFGIFPCGQVSSQKGDVLIEVPVRPLLWKTCPFQARS